MPRDIFELSDVPRFAYPSLEKLDIVQTAANIQQRLADTAFMSYGAVLSRLQRTVKGDLTDFVIASELNFYKHGWKNLELQSVALLLRTALAGKGTWYRFSQKPVELLPSVFFRPSIKGILFTEGQPYAVSINPRKRQPWNSVHQAFIARGVYEVGCVDDPNDPLPMIIDVSSVDGGKRDLKIRVFDPEQMMPEALFDDIVRRFFEALALVGIGSVPDKSISVIDLFRKPRWTP